MGRRAAFDPLRSYQAARQFVWKGVTINEGEAFTDRNDMRRLRQMYDSRLLRMTEDESNNSPPFNKMKVDELRKWLIDHGEPNLAHPRATRDRLIDRCRRIWLKEEQPDGLTTGHLHPQGDSKRVQKPIATGDPLEGSRVERERVW